MIQDPIVRMTASFELPLEIAPYKIIKLFLSCPVECNASQAAEAYREAFEFCRDAVEEQAIAYAEAVGCKPPVTTRTPLANGKPAPVKVSTNSDAKAFREQAAKNTAHEAAARAEDPTLEACPMCYDTPHEGPADPLCSACHGSGKVTVSQGKRGEHPPAVTERIAEASRKLAAQRDSDRAANAERKASLDGPGVLPPLSIVPVAPMHTPPPVTTKVEEAELTAIAAGKKRKSSKAGTVKANPTLPSDLNALEAAADAILAQQEPPSPHETPSLGVVMGDALRSAETSSGDAAGTFPGGACLTSQAAEAEKPPHYEGADQSPHSEVQPVTQTSRLHALRLRVQKAGKLEEGEKTAIWRVREFLRGFTGKPRFTEGEPDNEPAIDLLTGIVRLLELDETESQSLLKQPLALGEYCRKGYWELIRFCKSYSLELREAAWRAAAARYPCSGGKDLIEFLTDEPDPAGRLAKMMKGA